MKIGGEWRAWVREAFWDNHLEIFLLQSMGRGVSRLLLPDGGTIEVGEAEVVDPHAHPPTFRLNVEQVQAIVDKLAEKGIMARGRRHEEETALLKDHLEDMRALISKRPLPERAK